jgi:Phosphotransferase enzyme family
LSTLRRVPDRVAAGIRAAVSLVEEYGLRVTQTNVLAEGQAVVVRLAPAPVVARIGVEDVFGPRMEWQRGTVGLCRHLAAAGASVIPPSDLVPPGPYERDGFVVSFWRHIDGDNTKSVDPREAGERLHEIHDLAVSYDGELSTFWPFPEARRLLGHAEVTEELSDDHLVLLTTVLEHLEARLPTEAQQALHGDAHIWNTLQTVDGPVWFDFDEACRGPLEWDAATMIQSDRVLGPNEHVRQAYRAAFGDRFSEEELSAWIDLRVVLIIEWLAVARHRYRGVPDPGSDRGLAWLRQRYVG